MLREKFTKTRALFKENKQRFLMIGGLLATGALAFLGYKILEQEESEFESSLDLDNLSEDELRAIESVMRSDLGRMDYDSDEYGCLYEKHSEIVSEISSRSSGSTPHRENGRYLLNDD